MGKGKILYFQGIWILCRQVVRFGKYSMILFSGKIKDGKMYGRGSIDMKAGTIAGFFAIKCLKDLEIKLKGDVFSESVIDEENAGVNGTIAAKT